MSISKVFPMTGGDLGFQEPSGIGIVAEDTENEGGYVVYLCDDAAETVEMFLDRIQRSLLAGKNLFYEEWEAHVYDPSLDY